MKFSKRSESRAAGSPDVAGFYDDDTGSIQYLVSDPETGKAAIVDAVLGFDHKSASTNDESIEKILQYAEHADLDIVWILDTHPHADHMMASSFLKDRLGAPNAVGEKVSEIASLWRELYNLPDAFDPSSDFDRLFRDGDTFEIGALKARVMLSPGHTLGSITYVIGDDAAFVHDTLMQPDAGTARADFPGGNAAELYDSIHDILRLPDQTRLFVGHDYGTEYRKEPAWESTVAEQRRHNVHVGGGVSKKAFVELRTSRDESLSLPNRMLHVLQMNLQAGRLPPPESDGGQYLKIPLNKF